MIDWLFYAVDQRMTYKAIADQIKRRTGVRTDPSSVWRLVAATRSEYQDQRVAEAAIIKKLEGESIQSITETLLNKRLLYFAAKGDIDPGETAELCRLMLARDQLLVRRLEAASNLFKVQQAGAEFLAEILKDEAKAEAAKKLAADHSMTGSQYVERIRLLVYGADAVAKPRGQPNIRDAIEVVNGKPAAEAVS